MRKETKVVWAVGINFLEVGLFLNEEEATACFNEYCELEPGATVTLYKDGVMEDQRDPLPWADQDEEIEDEDEDCE